MVWPLAVLFARGDAERDGGDAAGDEFGQFGRTVSLVRVDSQLLHDGERRFDERMRETESALSAAEKTVEYRIDGMSGRHLGDHVFDPLLNAVDRLVVVTDHLEPEFRMIRFRIIADARPQPPDADPCERPLRDLDVE